MQHLMRQFVCKCCEFLSRSLAGQQSNLAACGGSASWGDVLRVFEKNALLGDEFVEPVAVFAWIAIDVADFRQFLPPVWLMSKT
jgi:hypothetical protein